MMYKFCPQCSKKITKKNKSLYICANCSFHLYENPRPTNGLIIENEQGEILLVKRKDNPKKGFWDVPGGFIDIEENIENSIQREIQEELGTNVKNLKYLMSTADRYLYKGVNLYTICFIFSGSVSLAEIKPQSDIVKISFFPKNKIPFGKIAFKGVVKGLKYYLYSFAQKK